MLRRVSTWLPWVLCAVALVLLALGAWLRAPHIDDSRAAPSTWLEEIVVGAALAATSLVGAFIASRQPDNPYGWLWCAIGLTVGVGNSARAVEFFHPPSWTASLIEGYAFIVWLPLIILAVLLFPTGHVPGPGWRWVPRTVVVWWVVMVPSAPFVPFPSEPADSSPLALEGRAGRVLSVVVDTALLLMLGLGLAALVGLVVRYRRAGPVERRQLTWFVYAAFLAVLAVNTLRFIPWQPLAIVLGAAVAALFPAAVAVAVLRYRLYDIDRIVSRTVTYGFLTSVIVAVYLLLVAVLPLLGLPSGSSDLVVAAVTLAVAALVGRVRRRLQSAVDRRFDRARYDARREVDAFATRLRDQVNLDDISVGLRETVAATVAPTQVAVWLRPDDRG